MTANASGSNKEEVTASFLINEESNLNPPESLSGLSVVDEAEESTITSSVGNWSTL